VHTKWEPQDRKRSDNSNSELDQMQEELGSVHASRKEEHANRWCIVQRHLLKVERQAECNAAQELVVSQDQCNSERRQTERDVVVLHMNKHSVIGITASSITHNHEEAKHNYT
jgi:hypothetical protein